jgi:hypothetical protein
MPNPSLDAVTARCFDVLRDAKADPQAYDLAAWRALRNASERLAGTAPLGRDHEAM